ncbi:hypothetical protein BTM25_17320 [Actinomadura rubteroloni]|uniref:Uncharacterized protein n=1 Tax=Actinomadura rubteroloni TaxID=1926885 RepID=A0A2P4UQK9_9ACTN|nr:hypothetical protein [Actinomadura rubteroloni]POM27319.1 hypothetical protein BTM25_17320 [Actinomadura rubteroloni]
MPDALDALCLAPVRLPYPAACVVLGHALTRLRPVDRTIRTTALQGLLLAPTCTRRSAG